jgi:chromosome segregation ATPase
MENMEKTLSRTKEQLEKEKKAVLSIQSEYNNCQGMYNQAMLAIEKLEDTQTLLQKQLEGSKMKSDVMAKNYKESQTILQQKDTEKQQLTQQTEESMAAKEEEIRKMKDEFVETIEGLKSQYLEVKVYNDFLRKEIRKLKGIPEDILTEEMESETLQTNKELYKQIENQRIQIENLKEQLELSLNL